MMWRRTYSSTHSGPLVGTSSIVNPVLSSSCRSIKPSAGALSLSSSSLLLKEGGMGGVGYYEQREAVPSIFRQRVFRRPGTCVDNHSIGGQVVTALGMNYRKRVAALQAVHSRQGEPQSGPASPSQSSSNGTSHSRSRPHQFSSDRNRNPSPSQYPSSSNGRSPGEKPNGMLETALARGHDSYLQFLFPLLFLRAVRRMAHARHLQEYNHIFKGKEGRVLASDIKKLAGEISIKNEEMVLDNATQAHLVVSTIVLATYRVLLDRGIPHGDCVHILYTCLMDQVKRWMQALISVPLYAPVNPISTLSNSFSVAGRIRGKAFKTELQQDQQAFLFVNIKYCFFNSFMKKNGAPFLTGLFCSAEVKMLEGIDPMTHNVRFDLPSTLERGQRMCSFQFRRMVSLRDAEPTLDA